MGVVDSVFDDEAFYATVRLSNRTKKDKRAKEIFMRRSEEIDPETDAKYKTQRILVDALLCLDEQPSIEPGYDVVLSVLEEIKRMVSAFDQKVDEMMQSGAVTPLQANHIKQELNKVGIRPDWAENMKGNLLKPRGE